MTGKLLTLIAACAALGGSLAVAQDQSSPEFKRWMELNKPEMMAIGTMMLNIGVCERFMDRSTVDHYKTEFMLPRPPAEQTTLLAATQRLYSNMYIEGTKKAGELSAVQCQRFLDEDMVAAKRAIAARKTAEHQGAK